MTLNVDRSETLGMGWTAGLLFGAQALVMFLDEFHYHHRRGLPRWERVGHPLDTASVLGCLLLVLLRPFGAPALRTYAMLAIFSCLFVTKDEWIHARVCSRGEHRLHLLLFALHPMVLAAVAWMWPRVHPRNGPPERDLSILFHAQLTSAIGFFLYQILYWNFYEPFRRFHAFRTLRDR